MTKKTAWVLGVMVLVLMISAWVAVFGVYMLLRPGRIEVEQNSVLEIDLENQLPELPATSTVAQILRADAINIMDLGLILREASRDQRISSVYLRVHSPVGNWAQVEEIRDYLKAFRKSNKKVYAHLALDMPDESQLYLVSPADEIYLNPDAGLQINGLVAEIEFYKKMMDKLKVEPQFLQFKEFKSPETWSRENMTPEFRAMLESVLGDIQNRFVQTVAQERHIEASRLRELLNLGIAPAGLAVQERLVTALGYRDEVQSRLMVDKRGGGKEYRSITASKYLKVLQSRSGGKPKHRLALVGGLGPIVAGTGDETWEQVMGGETLAARLREIRKEKDIKGVLFRIDSPGGSAVGSDKVWREIRLLEREGKPVVVSMAGVAGSGGYYIAMGARKIVAQPSTITGSIGVIFGKFNLKGLFEHWLGITTDKVKLAENADIFSSTSSLSEAQKEQIRRWMQEIYNNFVRKAAEGRGLTFEDLESKAHGRIYTGAQAKQLKLIDEVGGVSTAIEVLKKELKIPDSENVELVLYPKPKSLSQSFLEGDLFKGSISRPSLDAFWQQTIRTLETPGPWLLTPDLKIR